MFVLHHKICPLLLQLLLRQLPLLPPPPWLPPPPV
jgi:hypothetical protein